MPEMPPKFYIIVNIILKKENLSRAFGQDCQRTVQYDIRVDEIRKRGVM